MTNKEIDALIRDYEFIIDRTSKTIPQLNRNNLTPVMQSTKTAMISTEKKAEKVIEWLMLLKEDACI